ncbi:MAG: hypothetical protein KA085_15415 [Phenylobacterium sp.]|jgi:hypothetical protein|uniref:hypothetical protein n=1 Tax=Phenylobacterium sp. TaxID=1871053 RepID=UPI001B770611|nr:hypothetical protein [Phenylobacterium sp.]MBP7649320.1 hypothetical protein [Phenylobacterium sp.]MBP7817516.1 hypothetical protein [Phenylobacterium sp.]MBP9230252.1 hypothetical protein [Phenylobacterium sp.]MBP9753857.1 hypothetical protein [Phenylobacterium sp.]
MMKLMTLAALATLALAPAAHAEEGVRVSLVGKSTAQVHAEIVAAAKKVCAKAVVGETLLLDAYGRCMKGSVNSALEQLGSSDVAQLEAMRLAQR